MRALFFVLIAGFALAEAVRFAAPRLAPGIKPVADALQSSGFNIKSALRQVFTALMIGLVQLIML